ALGDALRLGPDLPQLDPPRLPEDRRRQGGREARRRVAQPDAAAAARRGQDRARGEGQGEGVTARAHAALVLALSLASRARSRVGRVSKRVLAGHAGADGVPDGPASLTESETFVTAYNQTVDTAADRALAKLAERIVDLMEDRWGNQNR